MKKILNALGMSVLFILIAALVISCGKGSGGAGGNPPGNPPDPTPTNVAPKITNVSVTPTQNIVLSGMPGQSKVTIGLTTTGNPAPSITMEGSPISGSFTTPDLYESKSYTFTATNIAGVDNKKVDITVAFDPEFVKFCGTGPGGKTYKLIYAKKFDGNDSINLLTPCDVDARYIFYRNLRADYERGPNTSCISSGTGTYTFNPSTKVLQFSGSGQPARNLIYHDGFRFRVEYVYNGSPRVEIYELVP